MKSATITGGKFLDFILTAAVEIPATVMTAVFLTMVGRRTLLSGTMLLCGVGCCISGYMPEGNQAN